MVSSLGNERHIDSSFPFETIRVFGKSTKEKSIGEMTENLARWRSEMVARTYYATKKLELEYLARISGACTGKAWEGISRTSQEGIGTS